MAIDPAEFRRRRQEKTAARMKKKKGTAIALAVVGGLLLAAVIGIFMVSRLFGSPAPEETTPPTSAQAAAGDTVIRLAAAGDLNITEAVVASGGENYNYSNTFLDVSHLLADPDISLLNLEGNLCGQPYGTDRSAPQSMMTALESIGVDMIQLANSYSIYKGMHGLEQTIEGVRLAGMDPLGVYPSAREAKAQKGYTIRMVRGVKIAFVAFTKGMDGMALPAGNEGCVNLLYKDYSSDYQQVDTAGISEIMDAVQDEEPDLTVVLLHWGSEYNDTISPSQTSICKLLQNKGADAIIGTHSHYVQKMEFDPAKGTFIAYSLGDFLGDAAKAGSEYSVILELEITKKAETGETKITGFSYTPIFTVVEEGMPLRTLRIHQAIAAYDEGFIDHVTPETYAAMQYALTRIEARIKG